MKRKYVVVRTDSTTGPFVVERNVDAPRCLAWSKADIAGYAPNLREARDLADEANAE